MLELFRKYFPISSLLSSGGILLIALCLTSCSSQHEFPEEITDQLPSEVDYNYHIKPILSDRCYKCHGPDANARKADLRLDLPEFALNTQLQNGGYAFVGKKPGKSHALKRIFSEDLETIMPPPESNLYLSEYEKALITKWVEQGAEFKKHWSFITPQKAIIPEGYSNPIDYFIERKLEEKGLKIAGKAEPEQLFRRINFDLTGLPPSVKTINQFLSDDSELKYETAIDTLLSNKHYGERMALDWLDLARYADSHGYQDDGMRNTWPWRQWVIKAFNNNLSYDQFLTWQLAGDLLPDPSQDQLIATCFNRNHPQTQEGGVVDEEYRVEYVADRTNTVGKGIMGLTFRCARCHDHKYDPISQKEYYQFFAFFNNNEETGIVPYNGEASPTITLIDDDTQKQIDNYTRQIDSLQKEALPEKFLNDLTAFINQKSIQSDSKSLLAEFDFEMEEEINVNEIYLDNLPVPKREKTDKTTFAYFNKSKNKLDANIWGHEDERPKFVEGKFGKGLHFGGDGGIRFNRDLDLDRQDMFSVSIWINPDKPGISGPIFGNSNGDFEGYRGWICKINKDNTLTVQFNHVWPDNAIDLLTLDTIAANTWTHIAMTYDGSSKANGIKIFINGQVARRLTLKDNLSKSLLFGANKTNWSNYPFLIGIELRQSTSDIKMDELKVYKRTLTQTEVQRLFKTNSEGIPSEQFEKLSIEEQLSWYLSNRKNKRHAKLSDSIIALKARLNLLMTNQPDIMVMKERKNARPTFILDRGAYDAPTEKVSVQTPTHLPPFPETSDKNRLGIAQWLTQENHPLTARVYVNRLWALCFGRGLVETMEDFGNQGNLPTHPELLDHLAVMFVESGWDIKAMMKLILSSETYQQSSNPTSLARELDYQNNLYSRYPAHRLPAEFIRDQALKASGLLVDRVGGPSVYPYQPPGIWEALATRNATKYRQQSGDSLYRRSIYTVWKRSAPPPAMTNFDAPDRYLCTVRRQKTSTPLQALVLMNDVQFLEAGRKLGERMIKETGPFPEDRIQFAFKSLTGRKARVDEQQKLVELYDKEIEQFRNNQKKISEWLSAGESEIDLSLDQVELATCTVIAMTIMNFDEFVIKR